MLILKQLRKKKNISQSQLADSIGVSLRTVQLYEKENANIPIKNLNKIAAYFEIGIDQLYARELSETGGEYLLGAKDSDQAHTIKKLAPGKYLLTVPLLMGHLQEGYVDKLNSPGALKTLPQTGFVVDQVSMGRYLAFEVTNNAMDNGLANKIPQGSIVLGKQVALKELPKKIKDKDFVAFLIFSNGMMCKIITAYHRKEKTITCHSLNGSPEYPDFEIALSGLVHLYHVIGKQTGE